MLSGKFTTIVFSFQDGDHGVFENPDFDGLADGKLTAAQKRAIQRDSRRYRNRPDRTQREENEEHERKKKQVRSA